jgi:ribosome-binding factor A
MKNGLFEIINKLIILKRLNFTFMESNRQKKIASVLEKDLAELFQKTTGEYGRGTILSITQVKITVDLALAKVYISIFPNEKRSEIIETIKLQTNEIRYELGKIIRHKMRRVPELMFFSDDSSEYIQNIEDAISGKEPNPIEDRSLLSKRKEI